MLFWLILLFTTIPIIELLLLIELGKAFGTWTAILLVLGTGVVGAFLAKAQGLYTFIRIRDQLQRGVVPTGEIWKGLCVLAGGILLLTPGVLSDIAGILLLCSPIQYLIGEGISRVLARKFDERRRKAGEFFVHGERVKEHENEDE